jgi:hypothetical protein
MKYVKMVGLAVVAAMALMAFAGAGTASASVLCKTATNPCTSAYPNGETIEATLEGGTATLRNTESSIVNTCTSSTVSGSLTNGSSTATARGAVATTGLIFGGCVDEPTKTITAGEIEIHATDDNGNGTVTAKGVTVTMPLFGVSCAYGAGTGIDLGTYTESTKTIHITAVVQRSSDGNVFLCPATAVWEANYVITKPSGTVFVSTS